MESDGAKRSSNPRKERERLTVSRAKSCAECQRSKLKCDRDISVPCSSCVRRGLASICPDGHLANRGKRIVVSGTEELHSKIEELTQRIHELEDALAKLQAQIDPEPHPLLRRPQEISLKPTGSLMMKEGGESKFYGASSSLEWMMTMDEESETGRASNENWNDATFQQPQINQRIQSISSGFPLLMGQVDKNAILEQAMADLPKKKMAITILDCYYSRLSWQVCPVSRDRFLKDHLEPCYDYQLNDPLSLRDLALVYAVLALGMTHYADVSNYREIAARYNLISQACIAASDFTTSSSLCVINALLLCAVYHHWGEEPVCSHRGWILIGIAFRLAITMGLHREPSVWGLPAEECQRRRRTMWDIVSFDLWGALTAGRPPMISRQYCDVEIPMDEPDLADPDPSFIRKRHHFTQNCFWEAIDFILIPSNQATYSEALELDRKIRNWILPKELHMVKLNPPAGEQDIISVRRMVESLCREIALLSLHRAYFACALLEPPFDPLRSTFARSFLAAYGSACMILKAVTEIRHREPIMSLRLHIFWTYFFSAAVILGSIAIRAPDCMLAHTALIEFDRAVDMLKGVKVAFRTRHMLPILLRLQVKAHTSLDSYHAGTWTKPTLTDTQLHKGLSGSVVVNQLHSNPAANGPPNQNLTSDLMTSLESVQPSFNKYLGSLGFSKDPNTPNRDETGIGSTSSVFGDLGNYVTTSDDFLQGVLRGQWVNSSHPQDSSKVPPSWEHGYAQNSEAKYPTPPIEPPIPDIRFYQGQVGPTAEFSSEPLAVSAINTDFSIGSTFSSYPRPLRTDTAIPEPTENAFLWDTFLEELGVTILPGRM